MIGGCAEARAASAAAMAGPQVRVGGGWNCDPSQTTAGDATAEGAGGGDDGAEDVEAHPNTPMATKTYGITNLFMASRSVHDVGPGGGCPRTAVSPHQNWIAVAEDEARGEVRVVEPPGGVSGSCLVEHDPIPARPTKPPFSV
jgi:hypothetical protein